MVDTEYAVIRSRHRRGVWGSHALHSKLASDWELFAAQAEEQKMKRLKRALFSRDADATASLWRKGM
jgi:hypothetical protein